MQRDNDLRRSHTAWLLLALLVAHTVGGIVFLSGTEPPPSYDPAYHFTLSLDYYDFFRGLSHRPWQGMISEYQEISGYYPPLFHSLVGSVFLITGPSVTTARAVTLALFLVLILVTYHVGSRLRNRRTGLLAAFIISTYPTCVGYSRLLYLDLPLLVGVMVSLLVLDWTGDFSSLKRCVLLGLTLGLGTLTKWFYVVFFSGPVLWAIGRYLIPISWSDVVEWIRGLGPRLIERGLAWLVFPALAAGFLAYLLGVNAGLATALSFIYLGGAGILLIIHISLSRRRPGIRQAGLLLRWRNFLIALFIAILIALPWYSRHYRFISGIATELLVKAADPEGGVIGRVKESGWPYYLVRLESFQLHIFYSLVLLVSLWNLRDRKLRPAVIPLWVSFLIPLAFLSSLPFQYPRYGIPYLGYVALISAFWVDSLQMRWRRPATVLVFLNGLLVYWARSFPLPVQDGPPRELSIPTNRGDFIIYSERGAGNATDFSHDWSVKDITARMVERTRSTGLRVGVFHPVMVLANDTFFHYHVFTAYSRLMGSDLEAGTFRYQNPSERVHEKILHAQFVIEKTGKLGLDFTVKDIHAAYDVIRTHDLLGPQFFRLVDTWDLPDETAARLYENKLWTNPDQFPFPREETETTFENGHCLRAVRLRPLEAAGRHAVLLWTEWETPGSDPQGVDFFVHVRLPDGTLVGSSGRPLVDECWSTGSEGNVREKRFLLFFPQPIPSEPVTLSFGLWKPEADERLHCRDQEGNFLPDDVCPFSKMVDFPPISSPASNEDAVSDER